MDLRRKAEPGSGTISTIERATPALAFTEHIVQFYFTESSASATRLPLISVRFVQNIHKEYIVGININCVK